MHHRFMLLPYVGHLKFNEVPPYAVQSKMTFSRKPEHLNLTKLKCRFLSLPKVVQKVHEAAGGKSFKIHGNVMNVRGDVFNTLNILPR